MKCVLQERKAHNGETVYRISILGTIGGESKYRWFSTRQAAENFIKDWDAKHAPKKVDVMVDQVIDGVKVPDDENLVLIPEGYTDPIITKEHFAQKGENILTCNMVIEDPLKKIGQEVTCGSCGRKFKVVKMMPTAEKIEGK